MSEDPADRAWQDRLVALGGSIHQDDEEPLDPTAESAELARIAQFRQMLDALTGDEDAAVLRAALWSLHPIEDYEIYAAVHSALGRFPGPLFGTAAAEVLPAWLSRHGDHDAIATGLLRLTGSRAAAAASAFGARASSWTPEERQLAVAALTRWNREYAGWQPVLVTLGIPSGPEPIDQIPDDWEPDWRAAAEAFRSTGNVAAAWTDERHLERNYDRVFGLLELRHGRRWRDVGDLLNPLVVRRRRELPGFAAALASLPSARRARILANLERARPDLIPVLTSDVAASDQGVPG